MFDDCVTFNLHQFPHVFFCEWNHFPLLKIHGLYDSFHHPFKKTPSSESNRSTIQKATPRRAAKKCWPSQVGNVCSPWRFMLRLFQHT